MNFYTVAQKKARPADLFQERIDPANPGSLDHFKTLGANFKNTGIKFVFFRVQDHRDLSLESPLPERHRFKTGYSDQLDPAHVGNYFCGRDPHPKARERTRPQTDCQYIDLGQRHPAPFQQLLETWDQYTGVPCESRGLELRHYSCTVKDRGA